MLMLLLILLLLWSMRLLPPSSGWEFMLWSPNAIPGCSQEGKRSLVMVQCLLLSLYYFFFCCFLLAVLVTVVDLGPHGVSPQVLVLFLLCWYGSSSAYRYRYCFAVKLLVCCRGDHRNQTFHNKLWVISYTRDTSGVEGNNCSCQPNTGLTKELTHPVAVVVTVIQV